MIVHRPTKRAVLLRENSPGRHAPRKLALKRTKNTGFSSAERKGPKAAMGDASVRSAPLGDIGGSVASVPTLSPAPLPSALNRDRCAVSSSSHNVLTTQLSAESKQTHLQCTTTRQSTCRRLLESLAPVNSQSKRQNTSTLFQNHVTVALMTGNPASTIWSTSLQ
jgi:hypothetical protein